MLAAGQVLADDPHPDPQEDGPPPVPSLPEKLAADALNNQADFPHQWSVNDQVRAALQAETGAGRRAARDFLLSCLVAPLAQQLILVDPARAEGLASAATFHPLFDMVLAQLRAWPEADLGAVRAEQRAHLERERAAASGREQTAFFRELARRYPLPDEAGECLLRAALRDLECGEPALALRALLRVAALYPRVFLGRPEALAILALLAKDQDSPSVIPRVVLPLARRWFADRRLVVGARTLPLLEWLQSLAQPHEEPAWAGGAWTHRQVEHPRIGATMDFTRVTPLLGEDSEASDDRAIAWHLFFAELEAIAPSAPSAPSGEIIRLQGVLVLNGGRIIEGSAPLGVSVVHDGRTLLAARNTHAMALDLDGGRLRWFVAPDASPAGAGVRLGGGGWIDGGGGGGAAVPPLCLDSGVVFLRASLQPWLAWRDLYDSGLQGLDLASGGKMRFRPMWRRHMEEARVLPSPASSAASGVEAVPAAVPRRMTAWTVDARRVYMAVEEQTPGASLSLVCLDRRDGRQIWSRYLCDNFSRAAMFGPGPTSSSPQALLAADGLLYVASNTGIVAALDGDDGRVTWITQYAIPASVSRGMWGQEERLPIWEETTLIRSDDELIVAARDSDRLLRLEAFSGRLLASWPPVDFTASADHPFTRVQGVEGGWLYVTGPHVIARIPVGDDAPQRREGRLALPERLRLQGRGLLSPRALLLPGNQGVARVELDAPFGVGVESVRGENLPPGVTVIALPLPALEPLMASETTQQDVMVIEGNGRVVLKDSGELALGADSVTGELEPGRLAMALIPGEGGNARKQLLFHSARRMAAWRVE